MTLTIDCGLGPNDVKVPWKIYKQLNLATPLVLVNRAPSISSRCIYACEVHPHDDAQGDDTMHVNPYLLEGLHADQDGDELNVYFLEYTEAIPNKLLQMAIKEMKRLSWKYGLRYDVFYRPRYDFSQYHRLLCHQQHEVLMQHSPLWASIPGSPAQRLRTIMNLGSSIMYDELDDFIELLRALCAALPLQSIPCQDMLSGTGGLLDIVHSGAKGSLPHVALFAQKLRTANNADFMPHAIQEFDKIIEGSSDLSDAGTQQFNMLYAFNSLTLHQDHMYLNDESIMSEVCASDIGALLAYNSVAVQHVFDSFTHI